MIKSVIHFNKVYFVIMAYRFKLASSKEAFSCEISYSHSYAAED